MAISPFVYRKERLDEEENFHKVKLWFYGKFNID